jgi:hypothetical protein
VCVVFAVAFVLTTGRSRPALPAPKAVPVGLEVTQTAAPPTPGSGAARSGAVLPPAAPGSQAPSVSPAPHQELTEALFVRISAEMLVAWDSFGTSEVAQRSYERACEGILERHGIARADFEQMEAEIASDPLRQAAVVDRVMDEADRLRQPGDIRVEVQPAVPGAAPPHAARPTTPTR